MSWDERFIAWLEDPVLDAKRRKFFRRLGGLTATLLIITICFLIDREIFGHTQLSFIDVLCYSGIGFWIASDER